MSLRTYRIGSPREPGEGLRLGTVRYLPRGVRKTDYARRDYFDIWLPALAPSRELFAWALKDGGLARSPERFFARYVREMRTLTDARQTLALVAALGARTDISIGCYCADESRCHRSELFRLLQRAQAEQNDGLQT